MKKNYSTLLQLGTLFIFSTLSFTNLCYAEKIYTWKDELGKMHYTNNPAMVPLKNNAHIIKMKALPTQPDPEIKLNGEALWTNNCARCHVLNAQGSNGLRGMRKLVDTINDPTTTPTLDLIILQAAIDDEMDDLATINLAPDETQAIATFIRQKILNTTSIETVQPSKGDTK